MNGVTGVGANSQNYQMTFGNKMSKAEKKTLKIVNELGIENPRRLVDNQRSVDELRETLLRQSLKDSFVGKIMKITEATIEHIKRPFSKRKNADYERFQDFVKQETEAGRMDADQAGTLLVKKDAKEINKLLKTFEEARIQAYLDELKKTDPELYREVVRRNVGHKVISMTNMEILEELVKNFFKKS